MQMKAAPISVLCKVGPEKRLTCQGITEPGQSATTGHTDLGAPRGMAARARPIAKLVLSRYAPPLPVGHAPPDSVREGALASV